MRDRSDDQSKPLTAEERRAILERLMRRRSRLSPSEVAELRLVFPDLAPRFRREVWSYLRYRGLSDQEKEDIAQDVQVGVFFDICRHGFRAGMPSLVRRITRNRWLNRRRSKESAPETIGAPSSGSEKPASGQLDVDGAVDRREVERRARELLTPQQWAAFEHIVVQGHTYAEAEALLGAPEATLRSRVARAKAVLFELVKQSPPSSDGEAA